METNPASETGRRVNLSPSCFRQPAGLRVFLEQFAFCLQPILQILSGSTSSLDVDLICAQLDFFTCRMALGNQRLDPCWKRLFYDLGHDLPLWAELSDPNSTSGEKRRALTVSYPSRVSASLNAIALDKC